VTGRDTRTGPGARPLGAGSELARAWRVVVEHAAPVAGATRKAPVLPSYYCHGPAPWVRRHHRCFRILRELTSWPEIRRPARVTPGAV
jgi:hypothetical protein